MMKGILWLSLALSALLCAGEVEQIERISKEIETLRSDYEACRLRLEQGESVVQKQEFRALRSDELTREENARLAQELQLCTQARGELATALSEASATIAQLKERAERSGEEMKRAGDSSRLQIETLRAEEAKKREALSTTLEAAQQQLHALQNELEKVRRENVKTLEKIKRVEHVKVVEKPQPKPVVEACDDPNPFPKLLMKETLR